MSLRSFILKTPKSSSSPRSVSSSVHSRFSIPSQGSRREHEEGSRYHELFDPQERQGESRLDLPLVLLVQSLFRFEVFVADPFPPFPRFFRSTLPPSDESLTPLRSSLELSLRRNRPADLPVPPTLRLESSRRLPWSTISSNDEICWTTRTLLSP